MYPGIDGFLQTRASLMLDVVVLAMLVVLPALGASIWLVRYRRAYGWHKRLQLVLGAVLLVTVVVFEADMRFNGWEERAKPSPHFGGLVQVSLWVHLVFAVTTALLWIYVIVQALRKFPRVPAPGPYSRTHARLARLAALDMVCTAVTGWVFYWLAFVAT